MPARGHTFAECVPKTIAMLMKEKPNNPDKQNQAIAFSMCREKFGIKADAMLLPNQPVAYQSVLLYPEGPMYKDPEDLKKNIGRVVPILDEHPSKDNDYDGMYSGKEYVWGLAYIKGWDPKKNALIADLILDDGAPIKNGYSIGFGFNDGGPGEYNGQKYIMHQKDLWIDHVALTNGMREDRARLTSGDTVYQPVRTSTGFDSTGSMAIVNNYVAHDGLGIQLTGRAAEIADKFRTLSPNAPEGEIIMRAAKAFMNEEYMKSVENPMAGNKSEEEMDQEEEEMEEEGSSGSDSLSQMSKSKLIAQLAKLQGKIKAQTDSRKSLQEKDSLLTQALDALEKAQEFNAELVKKIDSDNLAFLENRGFKKDEFKNKDSLFIEGARYATERINMAIPVQGAGQDSGGAPQGFTFFPGAGAPRQPMQAPPAPNHGGDALVKTRGNQLRIDVHGIRRRADGRIHNRRTGVVL